MNLNKVLIAGNLTRDPQIKFFANEKAVANFGLAINRRFKAANGEAKEDVVFVDVEAWGRTAELVGQYLVKGRSCFIEGRLKLDQWEDKDGQKRSKLTVVAESVQFTDSKPATDQPAPAPRPTTPGSGGGASGASDDPPFLYVAAWDQP
jgi:single-strand DNA-binding protein